MLMVRVFPKCTVQNENAIVQTADFISVHVHTFETSDGKTPGKIVILSNHTCKKFVFFARKNFKFYWK